MMHFIAELRRLSGGKPTGFKLCIGHPWEFLALVKAMIETGITPDFIVVDGSEGGTGAAPLEFIDHMGMPLRDGLVFVHSALVGAGLRDRIKLGGSGKITSAFDIARVMALGADWCNSARGFMFAVGCIQAQTCHTGHCPTGVATQDRTRQRAVVVGDKSLRVASFHKQTVKALAELVAAAGLTHPNEFRPHHFMRRAAPDRVVTFAEQYRFLAPGELLRGTQDDRFATAWHMASAATFDAACDPSQGCVAADHAGGQVGRAFSLSDVAQIRARSRAHTCFARNSIHIATHVSRRSDCERDGRARATCEERNDAVHDGCVPCRDDSPGRACQAACPPPTSRRRRTSAKSAHVGHAGRTDWLSRSVLQSFSAALQRARQPRGKQRIVWSPSGVLQRAPLKRSETNWMRACHMRVTSARSNSPR